MRRENVPEYTRSEIEAFVEASSKFDRQALLGVAIVFIVSSLIFGGLLWGVFMVFDDDNSRIHAAIWLGVSMAIAAASYWGYVLLPRVEWIVSQSQGIGQRVHDTQRKVEEIET